MSSLLYELELLKEQSDLILTDIVNSIIDNLTTLKEKSECFHFNNRIDSLQKETLKILSE